jgi:hypothetical protein
MESASEILSFCQGQIGSLTSGKWEDEDQFVLDIEEKLRSFATAQNIAEGFYFLNLHYLRPAISKTDDPLNRITIYIEMDDHLAMLLPKYQNLLKVYYAERAHLSSLMITQDWNSPLHFRLLLSNPLPADEAFIPVSASLLTMLRRIAPYTLPQEFETQTGAIPTRLQRELDRVKDALCKRCGRADVCTKENKVLLKELFGTLNLTLHALNQGKLAELEKTHIDIVLIPVSIRWDNKDDVIAVLVGILKNISSHADLMHKATSFVPVIHGIHHRELLFQRKASQDGAREDLKRIMIADFRKIYAAQTQQKLQELKNLEKRPSKAASKIGPEIGALEKELRDLEREENEIIKGITEAQDTESLWSVLRAHVY